jgi:type VI secretion system protein ImpF
MHVFRSAAESKDSRVADASQQDGDREISRRSKERREGIDEASLRRHLSGEMAALMNSINLEAVVDLSDVPHVRDSVLNYGFGDLSTLDTRSTPSAEISRIIRDTLLRHEPRLIPETIEIRVMKVDEAVSRRLTFDIQAEMYASPVDVPLQFVAEIDSGAGKLQMTHIKVAT